MRIFKRKPVNAPHFDRWLPRAAAVRELGERGMMSLTGLERLGRRKAPELLEVVTGQKWRSEGVKAFRFITKGMWCVYKQHNNNHKGMFTSKHSVLPIILNWQHFVVFCYHIALVIQPKCLWQRCNIYTETGRIRGRRWGKQWGFLSLPVILTLLIQQVELFKSFG